MAVFAVEDLSSPRECVLAVMLWRQLEIVIDPKVRIPGYMGDFVAVGVAAVATAVLLLHPRRSANHTHHVSRMTRIMTVTTSGLFKRYFMK